MKFQNCYLFLSLVIDKNTLKIYKYPLRTDPKTIDLPSYVHPSGNREQIIRVYPEKNYGLSFRGVLSPELQSEYWKVLINKIMLFSYSIKADVVELTLLYDLKPAFIKDFYNLDNEEFNKGVLDVLPFETFPDIINLKYSIIPEIGYKKLFNQSEEWQSYHAMLTTHINSYFLIKPFLKELELEKISTSEFLLNFEKTVNRDLTGRGRIPHKVIDYIDTELRLGAFGIKGCRTFLSINPNAYENKVISINQSIVETIRFTNEVSRLKILSERISETYPNENKINDFPKNYKYLLGEQIELFNNNYFNISETLKDAKNLQETIPYIWKKKLKSFEITNIVQESEYKYNATLHSINEFETLIDSIKYKLKASKAKVKKLSEYYFQSSFADWTEANSIYHTQLHSSIVELKIIIILFLSIISILIFSFTPLYDKIFFLAKNNPILVIHKTGSLLIFIGVLILSVAFYKAFISKKKNYFKRQQNYSLVFLLILFGIILLNWEYFNRFFILK